MIDITERLLAVGSGPMPEVRVRVGGVLQWTCPHHESVGIGSEVVIADPAVLALGSPELRYSHPDRLRPGITGGDAAVLTYTAEALAPGATELRVRSLFRGELDGERAIRVVVENERGER